MTEPHLTPEQKAAAAAMCMSPQEYVAWSNRDIRSEEQAAELIERLKHEQ